MRLVAHIGAGKTGSSSIQGELERVADTLAEHRMKYLGLMLEHASTDEKFSWQKPPGSPLFFLQLPQEQAIKELEKALSVEIETARRDGIDTLIWSNEWMFERADRILPALRRTRDDGVEVQIVAYARQHDRWIASAYIQWGIKNKTYPGPIRGFSDWIKGRSFSVAQILAPWLKAFGDNVNVYNFDAANDVVAHFFDKIDVPYSTSIRENVSPPPADLAAWAVFNNRFKDQVPENRFASFLRRLRRFRENAYAAPDLASLLPTVEELKHQSDLYRDDRAFVNQLLAKSGEPEMSAMEEIKPPRSPSSWEMDRLMLEMLFQMDARLSALERTFKGEK